MHFAFTFSFFFFFFFLYFVELSVLFDPVYAVKSTIYKIPNSKTAYQPMSTVLVSAAASPQVSFHVTLSGNKPSRNTPLLFRDVVTNQENVYNETTGYFTAPYSGTYFFIATSGSFQWRSLARFDLYVDNTQISHAFAHNYVAHIYYNRAVLSTLHGVVHLNEGQTAWVRSNGDTYHGLSSFSGFLLSLDP